MFVPVSARGFALITQQDIGQFRKGLELYHKLSNTSNKIRQKLQLVGFSYDKKSANVVLWKDKEYEYISSALINPRIGIRSSPFFACDMSAENNVEQSFTVWKQAP